MGIDNLVRKLREMVSPPNIERAALTVFAEQNTRIFEDGLAASGAKIGDYSTEPTYISLSASPRRFTPVGKTGKSKFADGSPHVSRYFPGGYRQFRATVGRDAGKVNLKLFGDLQRAWVAGPKRGGYQFGFTPGGESKKADGNERRFGKDIFGPTADERQLFVDLILSPLS